MDLATSLSYAFPVQANIRLTFTCGNQLSSVGGSGDSVKAVVGDCSAAAVVEDSDLGLWEH